MQSLILIMVAATVLNRIRGSRFGNQRLLRCKGQDHQVPCIGEFNLHFVKLEYFEKATSKKLRGSHEIETLVHIILFHVTDDLRFVHFRSVAKSGF